MDGGDWALLVSLVACGSIAYWSIDRFGAGRVWVPDLQGPLRLLGRTGFALALAGFLGVVVWGATTLPDRRAPLSSVDEDATVTWWAVASFVAVGLGVVLTAVAIVLGRRAVPSGHPDAQRHRSER